MKKLIALSVILTLSVSLLIGCGSQPNQIPTQQTQQQDDDEEMSWFEDEVLDMDDWGESKHKKVKPKTDTKSSVTKPSTSKSSSNSSSSKSKSSSSKKK